MNRTTYLKLFSCVFFLMSLSPLALTQIEKNTSIISQFSKKINQKENPFICVDIPIKEEANSRSVAANYILWDVGKVLKVKFLDGTPSLQDTVKYYANKWAKYGNFQFQFVQNGKADIRIAFRENGLVNWSYIGIQGQYVPQEKPTMVLTLGASCSAETMQRIILHEFGHALGLLHEHQHPENGIPWDVPAVYDYFSQVGWSTGLIDYYVLSKFSTSVTQFCEYDPNSVMHYPIPEELTLGDFSVEKNPFLSGEDTSFIQKLYPFTGYRNLANLCDRTSDTTAVNYSQSIIYTNNSIQENLVKVFPNYPNPFKNQTTLSFYLPERDLVNLQIIDASGKVVFKTERTFEVGFQQLNLEETVFNKSGIYFYQFLMGDFVKTGKMIRG